MILLAVFLFGFVCGVAALLVYAIAVMASDYTPRIHRRRAC